RDIPRVVISRPAPRPSLEASPGLMVSSKAGNFVPQMYDSRSPRYRDDLRLHKLLIPDAPSLGVHGEALPVEPIKAANIGCNRI
ncbi:MAG: hypothetical protein QOF70_6013, partial [Acetobacteraceae bacterium]|nr:hypothetical protein [Acetobacteraceae bacterium]